MYLLQLIALAIYVVVILFAVKDFKKTVLIWTPLSMLFNPQVCVKYTSPALALSVAVNISLVVYFFLFCQKKKGFNREPFFFMPAIYAMLVSYSLSLLFSDIPIQRSLNKCVKLFVQTYGFILVFYRCLKTRSDIKLFVKSAIVVVLLITLDGIVEKFTHFNLAGDFIYYSSPHDEALYGRSFYIPYSLNQHVKLRYGMERCFSFYGLHNIFGFVCILLLFLIGIILKNKWTLMKSRNHICMWACIILLFVGVIISNSKAPMLGLFIMLFVFFTPRQIFNMKWITLFLVCMIIVWVYFPNYIFNILSLTDAEIAEAGGGSSIALRQQQFAVAMKIFMMNPFTGMGIDSTQYFRRNFMGFDGILGAESCWLKIIPDQGIIGCIAYVYMYNILYKNSQNIMPHRVLFYYLLAIFVVDSVGGRPWGYILWWIAVFLAVRRYYQLSIVKIG